MKKLIYLLLLTPIIYLTSCSSSKKDGLTPETGNNPSSIIGYGWGNDILYKTTDGGVTWDFVNNLPSIGDDNKLSFSSEDVGIFGGFTFDMFSDAPDAWVLNYKTTGSGGLGFANTLWCWNKVDLQNMVPILDWTNGRTFIETSGNSLWFSLRDAKLRKFTIANDGSTFGDGTAATIYLGANVGVINSYIDFQAISFLDDNIGFALSIDGIIYKTTSGGFSWNNVGSISATTDNYSCLAFPSSNVGYATANSWLYKTTDGGNTWTQFTQINIQDIEFVTDNIGYGIFSGMLYQTTDGGDNWSMINDNSIGLSEISFIN